MFTTPKSWTAREIDMSPELKKELRQRYLRSPKKGLTAVHRCWQRRMK